jgi:uncharacterized protein YutE (UPF0331/DUF86 family)
VTELDDINEVLQQVIPALQEDGYTVYREPSRQLLPSFMQGYRPDAIALRQDKNLAIEVLIERPNAREKENRLKERFKDRADWELRIYYARPSSRSPGLPLMPSETIDGSVASVEALAQAGQIKAALLIGWATFEALARTVSPDKFTRPQTPARLIEVLATEGAITPSEADVLRQLANSRNRLVHGALDQPVTSADVQNLIAILKTLRRLANEDRG